jgi:hypothetical protein
VLGVYRLALPFSPSRHDVVFVKDTSAKLLELMSKGKTNAVVASVPCIGVLWNQIGPDYAGVGQALLKAFGTSLSRLGCWT